MGDPLQETVGQTTGISEEDRQEIILEIERVAGENKIAVTDDIFDYAPRKNGSIFPILVNIVGALVLVGGIWLLAQIFAGDEEELRRTGQTVITAESRLIEEIRRETEQQLAQQEEEIGAIQAQLASLREERTTLAADIEERIAQREDQLRRQFEAELEEERRRLIALDLSDEEIEVRLAEFTRLQEQEFTDRLTEIRQEANAEQERLNEELDSLEVQFSRTLEEANAARDALVRESEVRLEEVEAQLQERIAERESQLSEAASELARLSRDQERAELVRGQIRGLFTSVDAAIDAGERETARARLQDLRTLLNEDTVLRIPALQEQRTVDLLIVGALESLVSYEERFSDPETLRRLNDASTIQQITTLFEQAQAAAGAGDDALANTLYRQALEVIPAIDESHLFLVASAGQAEAAEREAIDEAAEPLMASARASVAEGEWLTAIDEFGQVLRQYPQSSFRQEAASSIRNSVSALAAATAQRNADFDAEIAALEEELGAEITGRDEEITTLRRTMEETQSTLDAQIAERDALIATLQQAIDERAVAFDQTEQALTDAQENLSAERRRELQTQDRIAELNAEIATLRGQLDAIARENDPERIVVHPQTQVELTRLREIETDVSSAQSVYQTFLADVTAQSEAEAARDSSPAAIDRVELLNSRLALERFLNDESVRELFPGMSEEITRYQDAYVATGRENAFLDVTDILVDIAFAETDGERRDLIEESRRTLASQPGAEAVGEFLDELELLVGQLED